MAYTNATTGEKTTNPGVPMKDEGNGWYTCTVPGAESADMVISVPELGYQTTAFTREQGEYWYSEEMGWSTTIPDNYTQQEETETVMEESVLATTGNIVVHFPMKEMEDARIYYWNVLPTDMETEWPGDEMAYDDTWYTYSFNATTKVNFLFVNGSSQTEDFTLKNEGEYWYHNGKWETSKPSDPTKPGETNKPTKTSGPVSTPAPFERTDFRDETIYFVMTTRFYDGDSTNNRYCWDDEYYLKSESKNDPGWRGDFKGLADKLDYIKALGFSAVWITPVVENASGLDYHGYHAYDFSKVDERYESSDYTYQDLINDAHAKGMKIIQDIVLNHTGNWGERNLCYMFDKEEDDGSGKSPFMKVATGEGALTDRLSESVSIYGQGAASYDEIKNLNINKGLISKAEYESRLYVMKRASIDVDNMYHHSEQMNYNSIACQLGQMAGDCVDLNTENPAVYNYLNECYTKYIGMGVDAFRIDTVKHISRLTFNKAFLPAFKEAGGENFYMFGECCAKFNNVINEGQKPLSVYFYTWKETESQFDTWSNTDQQTNYDLALQHYEYYNSRDIGYSSDNAFLKGNEYHEPDDSLASGLNEIDFYMHWQFKDAWNAFEKAKEEDPYFNDSTWNVTYVDSHDFAPDQSPENKRFTGTQDTWAENLDLMFTFRGIPCLYYGSEIEFQKGCPIDPMTGSNGDPASGTPYAESGRAYFGDNIEGDVNVTDYGVYSNATGKMAETLNYPLAKHVQRLNQIRRAVPALRKGQYSTEGCDGRIAFKRRYTKGDTDSFVCVSISGGATFSGVPDGIYIDVVSGKDYKVSGGKLTTECSGKGNMSVCVLQTPGAIDGKVGEDGTYLK